MTRFIAPSAREGIVVLEIRRMRKKFAAEYKPKLTAAANRAENKRIKAELEIAVQKAIRKEGLRPQCYDPSCLY